MLKMKTFKQVMLKCFNVRVVIMNGEFRVFCVTNDGALQSEVLGIEYVFTHHELEKKLDQWVSQKVDLAVLSTFNQLSELLAESKWSLSLSNQYYAVLEYDHRGGMTESLYGKVEYAVAVTAEGVLDFIDFINELPLHETLSGISRLNAFKTFSRII